MGRRLPGTGVALLAELQRPVVDASQGTISATDKGSLMHSRNRTNRALALLLPAGLIGASTILASAHATAVRPATTATGDAAVERDVANRLAYIRSTLATDLTEAKPDANKASKLILAWMNFGGFGWRNGGWRNGGWRNWGNGWHNWGNGWHNWGNGGWHNFWHNW